MKFRERCSSNLNILDAFQELSVEWIKLTWHSHSMNQKLRGIMFHRERTISFTFHHLPFDRHRRFASFLFTIPSCLKGIPNVAHNRDPCANENQKERKEEERKRNG